MTTALGKLLTQRFMRRALPKPNATYYAWRFLANGIRAWRSFASPVAFQETTGIARELQSHGIVTGPSHQFLTPAGRAALADAAVDVLRVTSSESVQAKASAGAASGKKKSFLIDLVKYPDGIPPETALLKVALDEKLLEIVAGYLGLWPSLHAIAAWLNYPTEAPAAVSQLWHCDPEDLKVVKVFIYLVDVDESCGPFTYIPGTHPFGAQVPRIGIVKGKQRLTDDVMSRAFPPETWRVCTGPAQTMILADTIGYHRGGRPSRGQRVLVTFTYTSATPRVDPLIRVQAMPAWASAAIQRAAVAPLLGRKAR